MPMHDFSIDNLSQSLKYTLIAVGNLRFPTRVIAVNCSDIIIPVFCFPNLPLNTFIRYILTVILACHTRFEECVGIIAGKGDTSNAYDIGKKYAEEKVGKFTGAEVVAHCPGIGRSLTLAALKKLVDEGSIIRYGSGRSACYVMIETSHRLQRGMLSNISSFTEYTKRCCEMIWKLWN